MSYIGNTPTSQSFISGTDYFNGNGSTTAFTLTRTVGSVNDIEAVVENVVQRPNDAYTLSGTTITFTSAPPSGTNNVYVRYLSTTTQSITPVQNSVSYSTMNTDLQNQWGTGFKNRIINGDMRIDQRNAGASVTPAAPNQYTVDRWKADISVSSKYSAQQSSTAPTGFVNSLLITSLSAYTVGSAERFCMTQNIEGLNVPDLAWGTANAKTITLSFWVRSSLTGTFGGAISNSAQNRSYPFTYTISSANTFEQKTITITGDTSGTWLTTSGIGLRVIWGLGVGSTLSTTAGAWAAGEYYSATGATSVVGTNGATWYITGVQLEVGSTATPFEVRPYGAELIMCQRYFQKSYGQSTAIGTASTTPGLIVGKVSSNTVPDGEPYNTIVFPVTMRATPTATIYGYAGGSGKVSNWAGTDLAASSGEALYIANNGFIIRNNSGGTLTTTQFAVIYHYIASNEL